MGQIRAVDFRGQERDVVIDHDGGYESGTNAHEIDWHFFGLSAEEHDALNLTEAEEQSIYDQLCESSEGRFWCDDDVI